MTAIDLDNREVASEQADRKPLPRCHVQLRRIGRNALYAVAVRLLVGIVKTLFKRGIGRSFLKGCADELFSLNPLKWASVVAGLSSFRLIQSALEKSLSLAPNSFLSAFVSGFVSASPVLVMNASTRTELMLYFLARAIHCFGSNSVLPVLPKPAQEFSHYDVVTMMITSSQILHAFLFLPKCHTASYRSFLQRATMVDGRIHSATAACHRLTCSPELCQLVSERGIKLDPQACTNKADATSFLCKLYHPKTDSCDVAFLQFIANHFVKFTMPLYLPLKTAAQLVFHGKKSLKDPVGAVSRTITSSAKSSFFLTVYCAVSIRIICLFAKRGIRSEAGISLLAGGLTGATVLLEDKPRRLDLAIYCLMQSIRSSTLLLFHKGYIRMPTTLQQTGLYMACVAYLYSNYNSDPALLHPSVKRMFGMLLSE